MIYLGHFDFFFLNNLIILVDLSLGLVICFGWFCTSLHGVGKQIYLVVFLVDSKILAKKKLN
jgi:hypothetical protein